ncbi:hypothetical protein PCANC_20941 [Puccinia coronata f. sp. avenae]|uniref:Uncharacterized protein n=1 Tax=Puccinia coronata f. sp. avenae TaxID=200324 RepID=A0A2N5TS60_9BASI|nr:hypothetical protein PCANC_20941 [Puccinia coronata f. sp. avenae]
MEAADISVHKSPLVEMHRMTDIHMSPEDFHKMRMDYLNANTRIILIGEVEGSIKSFRRNNPDQDEESRINEVLSCLAADTKNEIWMVTSQDVKEIEGPYVHIPRLNLAGHMGCQFSRQNTASVDLPDPESMAELQNDVFKIISGLFIDTPRESDIEQKYFFLYRVPPAIISQLKDLPDPESMDELENDVSKIVSGPDVKQKYFFHYRVPSAIISQLNLGAAQLNEIVDQVNNVAKDPKYEDYSLSTSILAGRMHGDLVIRATHKNYSKPSWVEALLSKHQRSQPLFALSIGSHYLDRQMHAVMKSRNHYGICHQAGDGRAFLGASHALKDHKQVITLLENLAGIKNQ